MNLRSLLFSDAFTSDQRAKFALRRFLFYIFYLINVLAVGILSQSSHHYWMTHTLECRWIRKEFFGKKISSEPVRLQFHHIASFDDVSRSISSLDGSFVTLILKIWSFIDQVLGPTLYSNHSSSIHSLFDHYLLIGVLRLRQVRVKAQACPIPSFYADEIDRCYPSYTSDTKQTSSCKDEDEKKKDRRI